MMVSANSAICMPAEPMVAGPSALKKRLTSSSHFGQRNAVITPLRHVSPPTSSASRMPAMNTPQAAAWPGVGKNTATASVATMDTLSRIGAAAAAAKRASALRMPPKSVTSDMSSRYGNVIRVSSTASAKRPGSSEKPGASSEITSGVKISAMTTRKPTQPKRMVNTRSAKSFAGSTPP